LAPATLKQETLGEKMDEITKPVLKEVLNFIKISNNHHFMD